MNQLDGRRLVPYKKDITPSDDPGRAHHPVSDHMDMVPHEVNRRQAMALSLRASRMTTRLAGIASILFIGLAAGCGNHHASPTRTPATSGTGATNSCAAITRGEAGQALGQSVRRPVMGKATVEGGRACVYYGPDAPSRSNPDKPVSDSVRVVLVRGSRSLRFFNRYRGDTLRPRRISNLGDRAYYDGYASVSVLKGDAYVRIAVIGVPKSEAAEVVLARDALPRI